MHCPGCHNPQTWDFNGGIEIEEAELIEKIISALQKNGIQRNLSILGGEPLCEENYGFVNNLIKAVKEKFPNIKIFLWSGYALEELQKKDNLKYILDNIYMLAAGPFILAQRDITLPYVGSRNQKVYFKEGGVFNEKVF